MKFRVVAAVLLSLWGAISAVDASGQTAAAGKRITLSITVKGDTGGAPGIPVQVRVRSSKGAILTKGETLKNGFVSLTVEWNDADEPEQIEAILPMGFGQSVGSIAGVSKLHKAYCLFLPRIQGSECP